MTFWEGLRIVGALVIYWVSTSKVPYIFLWLIFIYFVLKAR